jgi:hypothetical protein
MAVLRDERSGKCPSAPRPRRVRPDALRTLSRGAKSPGAPGRLTQTFCTASHITPIQRDRLAVCGRRINVKNEAESCIIRAR